MRAEAQQTITTQMGETVTVLLQELEEERAEGTRKDSETGEEDTPTHQHITSTLLLFLCYLQLHAHVYQSFSFYAAALTQRLKEKEKFLIEAGELLVEAQKHYETQRNKAEQLMREKASVIGEFQSIQDLLQAELDKAKFDLRELEVTAETLRIENKQMVQEISEISGDAAVDRSAVHQASHNSNGPRNVISTDDFGTADAAYDESSKDASVSVSRDRKSLTIPGK